MAQTFAGALKIAAKKAGVTPEDYLAHVDLGEKWCYRCRKWRPASSFNKDRSRADGRCATCRTCNRVAEPKSRKGQKSAFKGRSHSPETRAKLSAAKIGKPSPKKGIPRTLEERQKISASLRASDKVPRGSDCRSFKDGKIAERRDQRLSRQYKRWRYDVFLRDRFTCQDCGDSRGGNLRAHHIRSFADHPDLRFDVSNGLTLCIPCHKRRHAAK